MVLDNLRLRFNLADKKFEYFKFEDSIEIYRNLIQRTSPSGENKEINFFSRYNLGCVRYLNNQPERSISIFSSLDRDLDNLDSEEEIKLGKRRLEDAFYITFSYVLLDQGYLNQAIVQTNKGIYRVDYEKFIPYVKRREAEIYLEKSEEMMELNPRKAFNNFLKSYKSFKDTQDLESSFSNLPEFEEELLNLSESLPSLKDLEMVKDNLEKINSEVENILLIF